MSWRIKLRALFRKEKLDVEMSEEMRVHLELQAAENEKRGMPSDEARYAAQRSFGGEEQIKERVRAGRGGLWLEQAAQDVRYAVRQLARAKGFTVVVVLTLALGIGATTAIFSVVRAVLWQSLPFAEAERLVWFDGVRRNVTREAALSPADFLEYRERARGFSQVAAALSLASNLAGEGEPERLVGAGVTANYFDLLGVPPALGRTFAREEEEPGRGAVAVLSHGLWVRRFGADPSVLGRAIRLNGAPFTIVGVMPAGFQFPADADLWQPLNVAAIPMPARTQHFLRVVGRLKPTVTIAAAGAELDRIARELAARTPRENAEWSVTLTPLREHVVGNIRLTLLMLFAAVAGVLLIACTNVANLLLARGAARQREIAVRAALGAGRGRIVRQLLTESLALALLGGAGGVLLARWGIGVIVAAGGPWLPRVEEIALNAPALGFALSVAVLTGLAFGLVPALQALRVDLNDVLGDGGRGMSGGRRRHRTLRLLVVSETALAAVLLIGAGLLTRSFLRMQDVDRGFDEKNLLTARIDLANPSAPPARRIAFFAQLQQRVAALPGVEAVGMVSELPLSAQEAGHFFKIENRLGTDAGPDGAANVRGVNEGYFRAMRIPVQHGRGFTDAEAQGGAKVAVVSEVLARRFFPAGDALGQRLRVETLNNAVFEIVGITGDIRHRRLTSDFQPTLYVPTMRNPGTNLVVRTAGNPASLAAAVRREAMALDPNQPIANVRTMEQLTAASLAQPRLRTWLLGLFSAVALLITVVGIYGIMAYAVTERRHEFGVRMALGATARDVVRLVVGQGMGLALSGLALGLIGALALMRLIQDLLYGVGPTDPLTFLAMTVVLGVTALLACWLPARRAAKVDPMVALRCE